MNHKQSKGHKKGLPILGVSINVSDFGPIHEGSIDLRPLTIFVGPSNVGKTYLATLIYSLHRVLSGFKRPFGSERIPRYRFLRFAAEKIQSNADRNELRELSKVLADQDLDVKWSHLPAVISQAISDQLTSHNGNGLESELRRCFDLSKLTELIYSSSETSEATISVGIQASNQDQWKVNFKISSDSKLSTYLKIDDLTLVKKGELFPNPAQLSLPGLGGILDSVDYTSEISGNLERIIDELFYALNVSPRRFRKPEIHYLPAARSGIMQSHRIIASSLVSRSTRAGVERFPEIPTFAGPLADFMQQLLLFDHNRRTDRHLQAIADLFEQETLHGKIIGRSAFSRAYPEFVYRSSHTQSNIRLSRSSSMVSELAPIVLFLRGVVRLDSTVIIEEPEAHLHPAAQTQLAVTLARMIRAGLKLVVTTHSDWLLKAISNLIREGLLYEYDNNNLHEKPPRTFLREDEVGVWLFRNHDTGSSIEEIPFDTSEGLEPSEYEEVEDTLYNRAANLQNRIAESCAG